MKTTPTASLLAVLTAIMIAFGYFMMHNLPQGSPLPDLTSEVLTNTPVLAKTLQLVAPVATIADKAGTKAEPIFFKFVKAVEAQPKDAKIAEAVAAVAAVTGVAIKLSEDSRPTVTEDLNHDPGAVRQPPTPGQAGWPTPIPETKPTGAVLAPSPKVLLGFNVQAGVVANADHATGYLAGLQWLKYGTTNDPRNLSWAFLTPVFFGSPNVHEFGWLPFSYNVAHRVPHQPFTNIWVSPYVGGIDPRHPSRVGVALTATF